MERQRCLDQDEEVKFEPLEVCMGNPMIHNALVFCLKVNDPMDKMSTDSRQFCLDEGSQPEWQVLDEEQPLTMDDHGIAKGLTPGEQVRVACSLQHFDQDPRKFDAPQEF